MSRLYHRNEGVKQNYAQYHQTLEKWSERLEIFEVALPRESRSGGVSCQLFQCFSHRCNCYMRPRISSQPQVGSTRTDGDNVHLWCSEDAQ